MTGQLECIDITESSIFWTAFNVPVYKYKSVRKIAGKIFTNTLKYLLR